MIGGFDNMFKKIIVICMGYVGIPVAVEFKSWF